ncbi:hypothetical protein BDZ89DRAFT_1055505, partial [Hymenopellis radicata]
PFFPSYRLLIEAHDVVQEVFSVAAHQYVDFSESCCFCINLLQNSALVTAIMMHEDVAAGRNEVGVEVACPCIAVQAWMKAIEVHCWDSMLLQSIACYAQSHRDVDVWIVDFFEDNPDVAGRIVAQVVVMLRALFESRAEPLFGSVLSVLPILVTGMLHNEYLWLEAMSSGDFIRCLIRTVRLCVGRSITEDLKEAALRLASECLGIWRSVLEYKSSNIVASAHHHGLLQILRVVHRLKPLPSEFQSSVLGIITAFSRYCFYAKVCVSLHGDLSHVPSVVLATMAVPVSEGAVMIALHSLFRRVDWIWRHVDGNKTLYRCCSTCGSGNARGRCSRCRLSIYCDVWCQKFDQERHSQFCIPDMSTFDIDADGRMSDACDEPWLMRYFNGMIVEYLHLSEGDVVRERGEYAEQRGDVSLAEVVIVVDFGSVGERVSFMVAGPTERALIAITTPEPYTLAMYYPPTSRKIFVRWRVGSLFRFNFFFEIETSTSHRVTESSGDSTRLGHLGVRTRVTRESRTHESGRGSEYPSADHESSHNDLQIFSNSNGPLRGSNELYATISPDPATRAESRSDAIGHNDDQDQDDYYDYWRLGQRPGPG